MKQRILNKELMRHVGRSVNINGWVHNIRDHGKIKFLDIRDRTGIVQVVYEGDDSIQRESIVSIEGNVVEEERANSSVEVHAKNIEILSKPKETPPIELNLNVRENLETLLDYREYSIRHPDVSDIFKVSSRFTNSFIDYMTGKDFVQVQTPKIVASGTEGGTELFEIDYFNKKAYLAQSPQLYKQMLVGAFERVFEIGPVFRAEKHNTLRHLNEYTSMDAEMAFIDSEKDVMDVCQDFFEYALEQINRSCDKILEKRNIKINTVGKMPIYDIDEIREVLIKEGYIKRGGTSNADFENAIGKFVQDKDKNDFAFIVGFPRNKRPFYTMLSSEDKSKTRSFDLLYKGLEIISGSQREHDYDNLIARMKESKLNPENYLNYLNAFKYGMPPHGGFAIGLERFVARFLNYDNIRYTSLFPRDMKRMSP